MKRFLYWALSITHSINTIGLVSALRTRADTSVIKTPHHATTNNRIAMRMAKSTVTRAPVSIAVCITTTTRDRLATRQPFGEPSIRTGFKTNYGSNAAACCICPTDRSNTVVSGLALYVAKSRIVLFSGFACVIAKDRNVQEFVSECREEVFATQE
jgi:hypothetical protein